MNTENDQDDEDLTPQSLDLTASESDVVELYDQADEIAYGEDGNHMRAGREEPNFYQGGTNPSNANATEAGNPGGGEPNQNRTLEKGGRYEGLLSENGMHITENP